MEPNLRTIADLFAVPLVDEPTDFEVDESPREGETAEESAALGREALGQGDVAKAIEHFRRVLEQQEEETPEARRDLAAALDYGDQSPQAMRQYLTALKIKEEADPHIGLSEIYKRSARWRDAVEQLQRAIELEPFQPYHHIKLAETFRDMGERSKALEAAQGAVVSKPEDPFTHYWIGDLLIEMKRYDEALESLRAAIELSPGDDFLYVRATVAFWCAGRRPEAIKAIRLASDLDPEKHLYHGLLGILLEEMGMMEEAQLESERAKKMDRYDHDLLSRMLDEMSIEP